MGGSYVGEASSFLISTLIDMYILVLMLRFLFQLVRTDFYNPVTQFVVRLTAPPLRLLRRVIPGFGGVDWASLALMFALKALERTLVLGIGGVRAGAGAVVFLSVADLLGLLVNVYVVAVIAQVILSWVAPRTHNPLTALLHDLTDPVLRPARRIVPTAGGVDLSPLVVLIGLQLVSILMVTPIRDLGRGLL
jgi:YggT family protein